MNAEAKTTEARVERVIRFPRPLYSKLKLESNRSNRSANAEVLVAVEAHLEAKAAARRRASKKS